MISTQANGHAASPAKEVNKDEKKAPNPPNNDKSKQKQYQDEKMETGKVSWHVYLYYFKHMGFHLILLCFACYIVSQVRVCPFMWGKRGKKMFATSGLLCRYQRVALPLGRPEQAPGQRLLLPPGQVPGGVRGAGRRAGLGRHRRVVLSLHRSAQGGRDAAQVKELIYRI